MKLPTAEELASTMMLGKKAQERDYAVIRIRDRQIAKELRSAMRISKATYVITRPDRILELLEQLEGTR